MRFSPPSESFAALSKMAVMLAATHNKSMKAKTRIWVEDWRSWVPLYSDVSGEEPWPMFPRVLQIKKTIYEELSYIASASPDSSDFKYMKLFKAAQSYDAEKINEDPTCVGAELTDDWFINEKWDLFLAIDWPCGLRSCDGHGPSRGDAWKDNGTSDGWEDYGKSDDGWKDYGKSDDKHGNKAAKVKNEKGTASKQDYDSGFTDGFEAGKQYWKSKGAESSDGKCCYLCGATLARGDRCFSRADLGAGWRSTTDTHTSYLLSCRRDGRNISNFFKIVSFRFEGIMVDILHSLDLGVSSHLIANVLVEIMVLGQWGPNRESHMTGLVADIKQWYRAHKNAHKLQGELVFTRLRTQADWPKLKALW